MNEVNRSESLQIRENGVVGSMIAVIALKELRMRELSASPTNPTGG
jgi:hypothetical protein